MLRTVAVKGRLTGWRSELGDFEIASLRFVATVFGWVATWLGMRTLIIGEAAGSIFCRRGAADVGGRENGVTTSLELGKRYLFSDSPGMRCSEVTKNVAGWRNERRFQMFGWAGELQGYLNPTKSIFSNEISPITNGYSSSSEEENSQNPGCPAYGSRADGSSPSEGEGLIESDHSDAILKFITEMLMEEEDLEKKPCMLHDCLALQATEKSLYDALHNNSDHSPFAEPDFESLVGNDELQPKHNRRSSHIEKRDRHTAECGEFADQPSNKQFASSIADEPEPLEMYDNVLLCSTTDRTLKLQSHSHAKKKSPIHKERSKRGRPRKEGKKQGSIACDTVDLRSLLVQCAQAVSAFDIRTANELLSRVRRHSSPRGNGTERLAHYFANAIEARLAGTGTALYAAIISKRISAADALRAYKMVISASPFKKMSNLFANKSIGKVTGGAPVLHVIDFGILYGFQWPCLIKGLSERPGGPPRLRITGIDFPQPGFRPAERVEDTGRRLARYCERFGVPFEYKAMACRWENVRVEDLGIEENEVVAVNCLYRLHNVADETVISDDSPRDAVLKLIREMKPGIFVQGVAYGTYNTPFFVSRFREALFHFSSMFDMFEETVAGEDELRQLFEEQMFGRDVMNVIACEGTERIERPETHRQWQVRSVRAGFRLLPLDQEIVRYVRGKVRRDYHKDFSVDEDGEWMLQGWKGRVSHAISCWEPLHN
ncbi:Scarecrow-like protein 14 [Striga hermonthica]|uniref:Scarecrow-like protein 14 n=1 Tax=Striga hermonthica TaxID=68872 RepID=A0A9N7N3E8_STRHE|nr:Scarecrow-like protein 14 [Striga hermonthica]